MHQLTVMQLRNKRNLKGAVNNPYTHLLAQSLPPARVHTIYFDWKSAFSAKFDVLHVHWPEQIIRHPNRLVAAAKSILFLAFLLRIRVQRKALVRTVHNLNPHEPGSKLEQLVLNQVDKQTTLWIVLNSSTPTTPSAPTVTIQHGHYRDWYQEPNISDIIPGRLLAFGLIRAYKGIDNLIEAFKETRGNAFSLHICGRAESNKTKTDLETFSHSDPRIDLTLEFIPDDELSREIANAEFIVLPYREIHNSGVALLALSMNRPIIVRRSASTELLQKEFGADWVHLFDGDLSGATLTYAVDTLRATSRSLRVDMRNREWSLLATQLADAYDRAVRLAKRSKQRRASNSI